MVEQSQNIQGIRGANSPESKPVLQLCKFKLFDYFRSCNLKTQTTRHSRQTKGSHWKEPKENSHI